MMNRSELDAFVAHHQLSAAAIDAAFEIADARPNAREMRRFAVLLLQLTGVLSLAAGVVFFIAANWSEFGVAGRFVLLQGIFVASVGLAWWKPPPQLLGRYALLMAFITTGALLALFGQTYQTGADVYELFLTWAVLGLPLVVAGQWAVICAAWLLVLNCALLLFFGWRPQGGWLWVVFAPWNVSTSVTLLAPAVLNLLLWGGADFLRRRRNISLTPRWIARLALACSFGFLTWAGTDALLGPNVSGDEAVALLVILALEAGVAAYVVRVRDDVFPLALTAASMIVLSTTTLGSHSDLDDVSSLFLIAIWLVISSTLSGRVLMSCVRSWRTAENAP
jgi:uncharacterized membrane protein